MFFFKKVRSKSKEAQIENMEKTNGTKLENAQQEIENQDEKVNKAAFLVRFSGLNFCLNND